MQIYTKILRKIKQTIRKKTPFIESLYMAWRGERTLRKIRQTYGSETHIFLMRGATGDSYIQLLLLNNYVKEYSISKYKIIGDSAGHKEIARLFHEDNFIEIDGYKVACVEKASMLLDAEKLRLTIMFPWTYTLYINRCRIRMIERFTFMDTYKYYVFGLKGDISFARPHFHQITEELESFFISRGVKKNKTIIISPEANSITCLNVDIWNEIIIKLYNKGYQVVVNSKKNKKYIAPTIFCNYIDSFTLVEYGGFFLGLRSGFCDIISTSKCRKIIIYPAKVGKVNYSEHRTEIEFCGLKKMGLVSLEDTSLSELDTILVKNITDKEKMLDSSNYEYIKAKNLLINQIIQSI